MEIQSRSVSGGFLHLVPCHMMTWVSECVCRACATWLIQCLDRWVSIIEGGDVLCCNRPGASWDSWTFWGHAYRITPFLIPIVRSTKPVLCLYVSFPQCKHIRVCYLELSYSFLPW
jgi:hypothetical protein